MSIDFDDNGLAITGRDGTIEWFAYSALLIRETPGDRIILGRRLNPQFRLDLSGVAAREFRSRIPPLESRWSRLRRWAIRSPKLAALAVLIPAYVIEHLPGRWLAPITPLVVAARLDAGIDDLIGPVRCRSEDGQAVLDAVVHRLTPAGVTAPEVIASSGMGSFVSARLDGRLLVFNQALTEIDPPVLAALLAHELAHIEHGDLIRAAGRGEGSSYLSLIIQGSWAERVAKLEFSTEEEIRADKAAIDALVIRKIAIAPAAAFFARDDKARRDGTYWAQDYTDVHRGLPNRANAWVTASQRQRLIDPMLSERQADDLYNICWRRPDRVPAKWAPFPPNTRSQKAS